MIDTVVKSHKTSPGMLSPEKITRPMSACANLHSQSPTNSHPGVVRATSSVEPKSRTTSHQIQVIQDNLLREQVDLLWKKHISQTDNSASKEKARLIAKIVLKQNYNFSMNNFTFNDAFAVMTFDQ